MIPDNKDKSVSFGDTSGDIEKGIADKLDFDLLDKFIYLGLTIWIMSGLLALATGINMLIRTLK